MNSRRKTTQPISPARQPVFSAVESEVLTGLVARLPSWFRNNARDLPWRHTFDPYGIWVAEIMLQQTQVATVIPYWERWMRELPTIADLARADLARVLKLWEGLGYYSRARNLHKAASMIVGWTGGVLPPDPELIARLPGVGPYTLGAICSISFGLPTPLVDGNVARVIARVMGIQEDIRSKGGQERLWSAAAQMVMEAARNEAHGRPREPRPGQRHPAGDFNESLMELGATVCTAVSPVCSLCPAAAVCFAAKMGRVDQFPVVGERVRTSPKHVVALWLRDQHGNFAIRQRPEGGVNAGLWELPCLEVSPPRRRAGLRDLITQTDLTLSAAPEFRFTVKHAITRYRIQMDVFEARAEGAETGSGGGGLRWVSVDEGLKLAFASAHRRAMERLLEASGMSLDSSEGIG